MAIKVVVNGYFRSGTTFMWKLLSSQYKEKDYYCLYEPLSPDLPKQIKTELYEVNSLHGYNVYDCYQSLDSNDLYDFLIHSCYSKDKAWENYCSVSSFIKIIDSFQSDTFIQPNRMHFHLGLFNTDTKIVHVIRNPKDVYKSILKGSYTLVNNKVKYFLHKILASIFGGRAFEINTQFEWINKVFGISAHLHDSLVFRLLPKSRQEKFIVVWVVSNYYAIRNVKNKSGIIMPYELMSQEPRKAEIILENYLGLETIPLQKEIRSKKLDNCDKFDREFYKVVKKYRLENEMNYIKKAIEEISDGLTEFYS